MRKDTSKKLGLVLTGGGARAAYQAGVLRAIAEMGKFRQCPFPILTGISAGAINVATLAAYADDFELATNSLWHFWQHLTFNEVINTSTISLFNIGSHL